MNDFDFITAGKRVLDIEQQAISQLSQYVNPDFSNACEIIFNSAGRVVVSGMGKSGHIGKKIAATLASTGTPAFYVHPGEASHGDLGMITANDVVLLISNSGETGEILSIVPVIKRLGASTISMTGNPNSTLAKCSNVHICISVPQEACPLGLAPTASTTATLAMGDAIAVALLEAKGFSSDDFALSHPGGSLGKRLLTYVSDVMHSGADIPLVSQSASLKEALLEISAKGLGITGIVNENNQVIGVFTDGDLRRILDNANSPLETAISEFMTVGGICCKADTLAAELLKLMEDKKINSMLVVDDDNHAIGALNMHDLLKAGVI